MTGTDKQGLIDFAVTVYGDSCIESLCLRLQDECGVHVNVLLWAVWLDVNKVLFDEKLLLEGQRSVRCQNRCWVKPLRFVRRALTLPWLGTRKKIKALELRGEFWQLRRLEKIGTTPYGRDESAVSYAEQYLMALGIDAEIIKETMNYFRDAIGEGL